jgi:hypothetical protein
MKDDSLEEIQRIYREVHQKLTAPFPEGTLESKEHSPKDKYIPVQPYIHRLEEAAGGYWSFRLIGQPVIYETEDLVQVTGTLKILNAERDGVGFSNLQRYSDTKKIRNLKEAIRAATSDCLRDACDKYEMGWRDLAPYRKWASNPGLGFVLTTNQPSKNDPETRNCIKCKEPLKVEDESFLAELKVKLPYCKEHVPEHLIRNSKR